MSETAVHPRRQSALLHVIAASPTGAAGAFIVAAVAIMAFLAPVLAPFDPIGFDHLARFKPPSADHWLGTDNVGRDVLSRVIYGARPSLQVGFGAVAIGLPLGIAVGLIAGFYRGTLIEDVLMRGIEIMASIPILIWAIAVIGIIGVQEIEIGPIVITNEVRLIGVLGVLYVPGLSRVVHAVASVEALSDYVRVRRMQGASDFQLMFSDILPNCVSPVIVWGTLLVGVGMLAEAALSFLGLGVQPPEPSWGNMLSDARASIYTGEWWLSVFPGIAIAVAVAGFNLLGDALRDVLDPRHYTGPRLQ